MYNPDHNTYPETYTEKWLRHTREDTDAALFDEAFDELLARQDRLAEYAPQTETGPARSTRPVSEFPPRESTGGCFPSRPPVGEDHDERKAA